MGRALHSIIGPEAWDVVILVRYPTRRQFIAMLNDPDYRAMAPIRAAKYSHCVAVPANARWLYSAGQLSVINRNKPWSSIRFH
jgi:hypothetical protein